MSGCWAGPGVCEAVEGIRRYMGPCPGDALVHLKAATEVPGKAFLGSYCFHEPVGEPERVCISTELP